MQPIQGMPPQPSPPIGPPVAPPVPSPSPAAKPTPNPLASTQIETLRSDQVLSGQPAEVACPRCGEKNPDGSRFCHSCGQLLSGAKADAAPAPPAAPSPAPAAPPPPIAAAPSPPVAVVCSRCRGVADPGADFCKFCGARLNDKPADAAPSSPGPLRGFAPAPSVQASSSLQSGGVAGGEPNAEAPNALTRPLHGIGDSAPVAVRARLVRIAKDGSEGAQHPITADVTDIGRTEGSILLADDPYLSPRHARISVRTGEGGAPSLILADLGSVNGVFVRSRGPHPLAHGDLLLLGQQVLRFEAVTEIEGARGPAMQHGVLLFGSPAPTSRGRLVQRTVEGLVRDVLYLVRDEFVVGRESGDRTYPDDVFMSRRHATIKREASGFVLTDLGSSNGTFVQIHAEYTLRDGDQFRIGHHLFRVDVAAPGTAA